MAHYEWCVWTNYWWERPEEDGTRILLIGDSITNAYREHVQAVLGNRFIVNMIATSRALDDDDLYREIQHSLEAHGGSYALIHCNNGLHGTHLDATSYAQGYERLLQLLIPYSRLVTVALSTPVTEVNTLDVIDNNMDALVRKRNTAVQELAVKYQLPVDDLYTPMLGRGELRSLDGYHYNKQGQKLQGQLVANFIQNVLTKELVADDK